jgi:hypothetical protein
MAGASPAMMRGTNGFSLARKQLLRVLDLRHVVEGDIGHGVYL